MCKRLTLLWRFEHISNFNVSACEPWHCNLTFQVPKLMVYFFKLSNNTHIPIRYMCLLFWSCSNFMTPKSNSQFHYSSKKKLCNVSLGSMAFRLIIPKYLSKITNSIPNVRRLTLVFRICCSSHRTRVQLRAWTSNLFIHRHTQSMLKRIGELPNVKFWPYVYATAF